MNAITKFHSTAAPTMSSREIAELTGKNHADVLRDIRKTLGQLEAGASSFASTYLDASNRLKPEFLLPKREALILVSGYSVELRARIIDRWQELEASSQRPSPMVALNDPATLRGLLLGYSEQVLALEADKARLAAEVVEAAPKVEAFDQFLGTEGSMTFQNASKALHLRPNALRDFLMGINVIYRKTPSGPIQAYAKYHTKGYFAVKMVPHCGGVSAQTRITPQGLEWVRRTFLPIIKQAK
jgi:phage antirepressor YoqD-like protein